MQKIYIIHGWTYNTDTWNAAVGLLKKDGFEPIVLNVPGLTEPSDAIWDIDSYVDWLHEKLKGEKAPIVVGHSNGGRIALAYCQKYPKHFSRLILIGAAGVPRDAIGRATVRTARALAKLGKPLTKLPASRRVVYRVLGAQDYYQAPDNMKHSMANMLAADKDIDLSKVSTPTLLIWGRHDKTKPLKEGEKMHQGIKGSKLVVIDDAGHSPHATHPGQVVQLIKRAIESTGK